MPANPSGPSAIAPGVRVIIVIAIAALLGFATLQLSRGAPRVDKAAAAAASKQLAGDNAADARAAAALKSAAAAEKRANAKTKAGLHRRTAAAQQASDRARSKHAASKQAADARQRSDDEAKASSYFAWFGALAIALLWLAAALLAGDWNPFALAMGADNRLSTSKMQMLLWTAAVGFVYAMVYGDRVINLGHVDPITQIPQNVLIALGLSVTSVVAAKAITTSNVAANPDNKEVATSPSYDPSALVREDGASTASLTKVQILFWTVVAIVVYLITSFHQLPIVAGCSGGGGCGLPDIDTTLMIFMGLGHASYIGGKLAVGSTPSLTKVSAAPAQPDGNLMTLTGSNLGSSGGILINGRPVDADVQGWTPTAVTFRLPNPSGGTWSPGDTLAIALSVGGMVSAPITYKYTDAATVPKSPPSQNAQQPASQSVSAAASLAVPAVNAPAGHVLGIDVSYAQSMSIDWDAVRKRDLARFVIARASYASYPAKNDPNFIRNHDACKRLGIPFGAYHFLVFWEPGVAQARHFLQRIDGYAGTLCPAVDVEEESGTVGTLADRLKILNDFVDTVERALGTKMIIYTNQNAWNTVMGGSDQFAGHRLWVANPNDDPNRPPAMPTGFPDWTIYQYSWTGKLPLTDGRMHAVDLDVLKGDIASIAFQPAPAAPAAAATTSTPAHPAPVRAELAKAVYDGIDHKLKVFDTNGTMVFACAARNDTVADNGWRPDAGCPPGSYVLAAPLPNDPTQPLSDNNNWKGEGRWFVPINQIPGHDGIGIHGGGSCTTPPDSNALRPRQGWCPTENCIRLQNEDLETFVRFPLAGKPIDVVQSPAP